MADTDASTASETNTDVVILFALEDKLEQLFKPINGKVSSQ